MITMAWFTMRHLLEPYHSSDRRVRHHQRCEYDEQDSNENYDIDETL